MLWQGLSAHWPARGETQDSALMVMQPNVLRLIQHVAMQPPLRPPQHPTRDDEMYGLSHFLLVISNYGVTQVCGALPDMQWQQWVRRWALDAVRVNPAALRGADLSCAEGPVAQAMAPALGDQVRVPLHSLQYVYGKCHLPAVAAARGCRCWLLYVQTYQPAAWS
jgi:hypothetical protein